MHLRVLVITVTLQSSHTFIFIQIDYIEILLPLQNFPCNVYLDSKLLITFLQSEVLRRIFTGKLLTIMKNNNQAEVL